MRYADKDFDTERLLVTIDKRLKYSRLKNFSGSFEKKRDIASTAPFAQKKNLKKCQSFNQSLSLLYLINGRLIV